MFTIVKVVLAILYLGIAWSVSAIPAPPSDSPIVGLSENQSTLDHHRVRRNYGSVLPDPEGDVIAQVNIIPERNSSIIDGRGDSGDLGSRTRIDSGSTMMFGWKQNQFDADEGRGQDSSERGFQWWVHLPEEGTKKLIWIFECTIRVSHDWRGTAQFSLAPLDLVGPLRVPAGQTMPTDKVYLSCPKERRMCVSKLCDLYPLDGI
ncbi:hypothetical protein IAT40_005535 [Kwoniella sp. CBS 6097]